MHREEETVELSGKANDLSYLSDLFVECVYAQRKSLRHKLVRMRTNNNPHSSVGEADTHKSLLQTYLQIVKTGAPEEIERFSKFERQKLVELLSTN